MSKMKVNNNNNRIKHKIRLLFFVLYNISFALYMAGIISRIYYILFILIFCAMNALVIIRQKRPVKNGLKELRLGIISMAVLFLLSIVMQILNNRIELSYVVGDLFRMVMPIVSAFLLANTFDKDEIGLCFDVLLIRFILQFLLINASHLSIGNILAISWSNSSSIMESSLAHDFIVLEMLYLMLNKQKKAFLCMIFCMLSMKRISFIAAPLLFIFSKSIQPNSVNRRLLSVIKIITIISPIIVVWLYKKETQEFLQTSFNINLNAITSGRVQIYNLLQRNIGHYNGLGSSNAFLGEYARSTFNTTWNGVLHNDILRLFLETTIIGVAVYVRNFFEIIKNNKWLFLMGLYLIVVAITSHIFNYFSVWVTFYMAVMSAPILLANHKERGVA